MLLDFYFQGQVYIIVYVGAIAIQFQFIIMMVECNTSSDTISPHASDLTEEQGAYETSPTNNILGRWQDKKEYIPIRETGSSIFCKNNLIPCKNGEGISFGHDAKIINYLFSDICSKKNTPFTLSKGHNNMVPKQMDSVQQTQNIKNIKAWKPVDIRILNRLILLKGTFFGKIIFIFSLLSIAFLYLYSEGSFASQEQKTIFQDKYGEDTRPVWAFINDNIYTIYTYFNPVWAIDFISMTDQETQGIMSYIAYPAAQIQIGLTLWAVMIGIISICSPQHR